MYTNNNSFSPYPHNDTIFNQGEYLPNTNMTYQSPCRKTAQAFTNYSPANPPIGGYTPHSPPQSNRKVFNGNSAFKSPMIDMDQYEMSGRKNNEQYQVSTKIFQLKDIQFPKREGYGINNNQQDKEEQNKSYEESYQNHHPQYQKMPNDSQQQLISPNQLQDQNNNSKHTPTQSSSEEPLSNTNSSPMKKKRTCNCRKTKCLKLYCDCFSFGELCGPDCNCQECQNDHDHEEQRRDAIIQILDKHPDAFSDKIKKKGAKIVHQKGCNCRKSNCLKKYCECYSAGIKCSEHCKCDECKNMDNKPRKKIHLPPQMPMGYQNELSNTKLNHSNLNNITYDNAQESDPMLQTPYTNKIEKRFTEVEAPLSAEKEADTTIKKRSFVKRTNNSSNIYQHDEQLNPSLISPTTMKLQPQININNNNNGFSNSTNGFNNNANGYSNSTNGFNNSNCKTYGPTKIIQNNYILVNNNNHAINQQYNDKIIM